MRTLLSITGAVITGIVVSTSAASAQGFEVLYAFPDQGPIEPRAPLIQATDGNFYGTTTGGLTNLGTVFKMTPSGAVTVLHTFVGGSTDGAVPFAALIQARDGNFYGTTTGGGAHDLGTVFKMTPAGAVTVLHAFIGGTTDGAVPWAALIQAADGNFYGTTTSGGASGFGTVFRMTVGGTVTLLYAFTDGLTGGAPGAPYASVIQATDGNFYGTTVTFQDYTGAGGVIFKMTPSGTVAILASVPSYASLIQATDGNFYGTSVSGDLSPHAVFKMTPGGTVTVLNEFPGPGADGALIQPTDGNFYGTTAGHASHGEGRVFKMTPSGRVTVLHTFRGGMDGAYPFGALVQATDGTFYGTTSFGGASGTGVVFRLDTTVRKRPHSDFDGDGKADVTVFRPSTGQWFVRRSNTFTPLTVAWGVEADRPVPGDYDGDGLTDIAVFRRSTGEWFIRLSSSFVVVTLLWGGVADIPVPGDYDDDGLTDVAVFDPSTGEWSVRQSTTLTLVRFVWGGGTDIPAQRDYDGDGIVDIAVFRPPTGEWFVRQSSTSSLVTFVWGGGSDQPVAEDYDGDGKADIAVFRPTTGEWFVRQSATVTLARIVWGGGADIPVPADYDGDGETDIAVFRPSTGEWFVRQSNTLTLLTVVWGGGSDVPILTAP